MRKWMVLLLVFSLALALIWSCGDDDESKSEPTITKIYMFSTGLSTYKGNLGGRSGAEAKLISYRPPSFSNKTIRAFITIDETDTIAGMPAKFGFPANVPIVNATETAVIADNWADLLDGNIKVSLVSAGVVIGGSYTSYWTGSLTNGTIATHCSNWTSYSTAAVGTVGDGTATDGTWLTSHTNRNGSDQYGLIGICY